MRGQTLITTGEAAAAALARIDALHTALTQIVLEGGALDQIAAEVARVLGVDVLVTSTDGRERAAVVSDASWAALTERELVDPTGRFRVERASGRGIEVGAGELRQLRIVAGGDDLGRLVAFRAEGPVSADDVHALERAAAVAALLITREEAVTAVENKYRGDFLRDVFLRRAGNEQYVVEHARSFGWDLTWPVVVVAAEIDPLDAGESPVSSRVRRRWQERFAHAWSVVAKGHDDSAPSVDFSSEVVTIVPLRPPGGGTSGADDAPEVDLGAFAERSVGRIVAGVAGDRGGGRRPFSVGVSRVVTGIAALPDAYAQARRAVEVGRRVHGGRSTTYFDQLGVHRLIALVPDEAELASFTADVLGPLAGDDAEAVDLRETLQVLLDTNFNVAEAARTQFFHYNTMRYRVGKLERLLGPLSRDPHLRLDVAVALRVLEVLRPGVREGPREPAAGRDGRGRVTVP